MHITQKSKHAVVLILLRISVYKDRSWHYFIVILKCDICGCKYRSLKISRSVFFFIRKKETEEKSLWRSLNHHVKNDNIDWITRIILCSSFTFCFNLGKILPLYFSKRFIFIFLEEKDEVRPHVYGLIRNIEFRAGRTLWDYLLHLLIPGRKSPCCISHMWSGHWASTGKPQPWETQHTPWARPLGGRRLLLPCTNVNILLFTCIQVFTLSIPYVLALWSILGLAYSFCYMTTLWINGRDLTTVLQRS